MRVAIVATSATRTNEALCRAGRWQLLTPSSALSTLRPGDIAVGRLDVLPTLDGIEAGLWALGELEARGVRVINGTNALLATHDKLLTARLLHQAGLPHPRTRLIRVNDPAPRESGAVVLKPRFGSWGRDVTRCDSPNELVEHLQRLRDIEWFKTRGVLVQGLVPPQGCDLRLVVAAERVVGAVVRISAAGEWRTNVALGARRIPAIPPRDATQLAVEAARALGAGLVGVDLLPDDDGRWTILELNGAVDFTGEYSTGRDVFQAAVAELSRLAARSRRQEGATARSLPDLAGPVTGG